MSPSSSKYPALHEGFGPRGKLPRIRQHMERRRCVGRLWIFLVLGALIVVFGVVIGGLYFNIQNITTSTEYTEILPTIISSAVVIAAGLLVSLLFWRRWRILVLVTVAVCMVTGFLCAITAVLTVTHVVKPLVNFSKCTYYRSQSMCRCFSRYQRDLLILQYLEEETTYDFEDISSCDTVTEVIPQLLYALCAFYAAVVLLCLGAAVLALLVLRLERNKRGFLEDDTYEEVYTVSGSSNSSTQDQSDSENEPALPVVITSPIGHSLPSNIPQGKTPVPKETTLDRSKLLKTPVLVKGEKGCSDVGKDTISQLRCTRARTPSFEIQSRGRNKSFLPSKRLSRSCDSLDSLDNTGDNSSTTDSSKPKKKGKLKEHRRRGRRAVTLHNLDTKQLMLILSLQMRYLEETKEYKSQKNLTEKQGPNQRRALTPQPTSQKNVIPQNIRSHTPQPYKGQKSLQQQQQEELFKKFAISGIEQGQGRMLDHCSNQRTSEESAFLKPQDIQGQPKFHNGYHKTAPILREGYNPYQQQVPLLSADNIHYVAYEDNMLSFQGSKPKSRPSVQDHFLPPTPLHRHDKSSTLPPKPITRQRSRESSLPPEPIHRGKSAFHVVDSQRNTGTAQDQMTPRRDKAGTPLSKPIHTIPQDIAEHAIRENFRMYPSHFMLRNTEPDVLYPVSGKSHTQQVKSVSGKYSQASSEPPPPYAPPPTYTDFVSSCETSVTSSTSSNPEEIYSMPEPRRKGRREERMNRAGPIPSSSRPVPQLQHITETFYSNEEVYPPKRELVRKEEIYSSPAKSFVKPIIVPEDYYSQVEKYNKRNEIPVYANAHSVQRNEKLSQNIKVGPSHPLVFHEYEDVYDPSDPVCLQNKPGNTGNIMYGQNFAPPVPKKIDVPIIKVTDSEDGADDDVFEDTPTQSQKQSVLSSGDSDFIRVGTQSLIKEENKGNKSVPFRAPKMGTQTLSGVGHNNVQCSNMVDKPGQVTSEMSSSQPLAVAGHMTSHVNSKSVDAKCQLKTDDSQPSAETSQPLVETNDMTRPRRSENVDGESSSASEEEYAETGV